MNRRKRDQSPASGLPPIDLQFRPDTYWPARSSRASVMGGGMYLPKLAKTEVEIARVRLGSTLSDVISIRARRHRDRIRYRVFDEYTDQGSEYEITRHESSKLPLTMQELIELIDSVEHVQGTGLTEVFRESQMGVLDAEEAVGFVEVRSTFYPELHAHYKSEAQDWLQPYARKQARDQALGQLHGSDQLTRSIYGRDAVTDPATLPLESLLFSDPRMSQHHSVAELHAALTRWARYRLGLDGFSLSCSRGKWWALTGVKATWLEADGTPGGGAIENQVAALQRALSEAPTDPTRGALLLRRDLSPDSALSPLERADLTWYLGDKEVAKAMLREVAATNFGAAVDRLISAGDHQAARELCDAALRAKEGQAGALDVEREEVLVRLAYLALAEGDEDRALELWTESKPDE